MILVTIVGLGVCIVEVKVTVIFLGRGLDGVVRGQIIGGVDKMNGNRAIVGKEEQGCIDAETKKQEHDTKDGIMQVKDGECKDKIDDGDYNDD